jgi:GntR family transcriptional regulator, transcriptional repressor for pyruvate dehydrogenase complex
MSYPTPQMPKRTRSLTDQVVETLTKRVSRGLLKPGTQLPTESEIVREMGVSRTVVREALSRLQAGGLVETRRGIGTFALKPPTSAGFSLDPTSLTTLQDVLSVLELRISLETETAGLAALRRTDEQLKRMQTHLLAFRSSVAHAGSAVNPDFEFHLEIARATENRYFVEILTHLGATLIPRARVDSARLSHDEQSEYLARVHREHESVFDAIAGRDSETARGAMRTHLSNSRERLRRAFEAAKAIKGN